MGGRTRAGWVVARCGRGEKGAGPGGRGGGRREGGGAGAADPPARRRAAGSLRSAMAPPPLRRPPRPSRRLLLLLTVALLGAQARAEPAAGSAVPAQSKCPGGPWTPARRGRAGGPASPLFPSGPRARLPLRWEVGGGGRSGAARWDGAGAPTRYPPPR